MTPRDTLRSPTRAASQLPPGELPVSGRVTSLTRVHQRQRMQFDDPRLPLEGSAELQLLAVRERMAYRFRMRKVVFNPRCPSVSTLGFSLLNSGSALASGFKRRCLDFAALSRPTTHRVQG